MLAGCTHVNEFKDEGVPTPAPVPINSFQLQWSAILEGVHGPITRIYARDTLIFGYTDDGTSYVIDRPTGTILHVETIRHGNEALHPPVVLKDFIVYPTNVSLEIYDRKGNLSRSKNLGYSIRSDAVGSKSYVYLGADYMGGGRLMAIDVNSEYLDHRWALMFPGSAVSAAPAVMGDIVYAAAENGKIVAVAYDTREPVWTVEGGTFQTYGAVVADLAADESGVYAASTDTKLVALNRNNGKVKWQYTSNVELRDAPVLTKDFVFQNVLGVGLAALDKGAGAYNRSPRWIVPDAVKVLSEDEKYVYVLRTDRAVVALDKQNGKPVFTSNRHDLVTFTTNTRDGFIFATTTANRMVALAPVLKPGVVGEQAWTPVAPTGTLLAMGR